MYTPIYIYVYTYIYIYTYIHMYCRTFRGDSADRTTRGCICPIREEMTPHLSSHVSKAQQKRDDAPSTRGTFSHQCATQSRPTHKSVRIPERNELVVFLARCLFGFEGFVHCGKQQHYAQERQTIIAVHLSLSQVCVRSVFIISIRKN